MRTRRELAEGSGLGRLYLERLRRRQLALSLLALVAFLGLVGALPLVLLLLGDAGERQVLGIPLDLLLVVVPPFAAFVALGWVYEKRATGLDDAFRELVDDER
jgi:hypothetical protein